MAEKRFQIGDKVTYKYRKDLPGHKYKFGGSCVGGFVGEVRHYGVYSESSNCYEISVTTKGGHYNMLESEFVEYDQSTVNGENYEIY